MAREVRADPQDLEVSAIRVAQHAEEVEVGHAASQGRVEAAQTGWTGMSAVAMTARAAKWQANSAVLATRLADHRNGLHTSAHGCAATEASNEQNIADVGVEGSSTSGSIDA
jgi:WXG100 family type VII secretion target